MKKLAKHDLVEVIWMDARSCPDAWEWKGEVSTGLVRVRSLGYVVVVKKRSLTLAMSRTSSQYGKSLSIPLGCVRRVRKLG